MKTIFQDKISAITANEEDANYLVENAIDNDSVRKVWRATSTDAIVTLTVDGGSDTVAIFGTNVGTITVTIKDITETTTIYGPTEYDLRGVDTLLEFMTDDSEGYTSVWAEYPLQSVSHKIIIEFEGAIGVVAEAGIIRAGLNSEYLNPQYGLSESYIDYSIVKYFNNDSTFVNPKTRVRTFSGEFRIDRDAGFVTLLNQIVNTTGPLPLPWLIIDERQQTFSVYARLTSLFDANHVYVDDSVVGFDLLEMV